MRRGHGKNLGKGKIAVVMILSTAAGQPLVQPTLAPQPREAVWKGIRREEPKSVALRQDASWENDSSRQSRTSRHNSLIELPFLGHSDREYPGAGSGSILMVPRLIGAKQQP